MLTFPCIIAGAKSRHKSCLRCGDTELRRCSNLQAKDSLQDEAQGYVASTLSLRRQDGPSYRYGLVYLLWRAVCSENERKL
ncbi:hypothetical protein Naga_100234g10 [Nannochloropsis gaditana]|uniref:Uncharacterized protein n=1 Tax=Nannochloropsis gaditana TaxID=72520 RepID=W7TWT4_9STRA|nr:hypothetical protein Naga_100234g10 [Nannochloropsis gaditana]